MSIQNAINFQTAVNGMLQLQQIRQNAQQNATLGAMLNEQQRMAQEQKHREWLQQMVFAANEVLKQLEAIPWEKRDGNWCEQFVEMYSTVRANGLRPEYTTNPSFATSCARWCRPCAAT